MRLLYLRQLRSSPCKLSFFSAANSLMGSKLFCKTNPFCDSYSFHSHCWFTNTTYFSAFSSKRFSRVQPLCMKTNGYSSHASHARVPRPPAYIETQKESMLESTSSTILKRKLLEIGVDLEHCVPGQQVNLLCPMFTWISRFSELDMRAIIWRVPYPAMTPLKDLPHKGKCKCQGGESEEKSLSLHIAEDWSSAVWLCFRGKCGWRGGTRAFADSRPSKSTMENSIKVKNKRQITVEGLHLQPLCNELVNYFAQRLISRKTLERNSVMEKRYDGQFAIAFTYWRRGSLVSCKYRDAKKNFWQEADTEKILYGLDDIEGASDVIIVEGEMDKLAMEEAGLFNCVSVPDGAPASVSTKELPPKERDTKYQYLWNCKDYLKEASRIILATDGDLPGQALAEEIARRLGRERCWRVRWPKKNENEHYKDANEVLMYLGPSALKEVIDNAELYPIRGLFNFRDYFDEIDAYYHQTLGYEYGVSTGWTALNDLYNVMPGELTIVTGVPNSGKSEWIDALLCNLNASVGWKFALCSMENKVREHARKLLEKKLKKPFFNARYGESAERMSVDEFEEGKQWLTETFYLIRCENDSLPNIKWVLDLAKAAVLRHGIRGLVIDPYNELDHQRPPSQTETEYVSQMLTKVKRFAQHHSCHVWFVAHPRQLHQWVGSPPNLYDISGSAHFINKCDNGIVIHRNRDPQVGPVDQVQVCVRKVRNKVAGTIGEAFLSYNRVTGEFVDVDSTPGKK